jgi:NADH:quinone reductase (non-electrogenic)
MDVAGRTDRHKVVVIGGGFAGGSAVRALKSSPADVTLIDSRNFHLFQPLLYQVATGSLSPSEISTPLRSIFRRQDNVRVLLGEVSRIDAERRFVTLSDGTRVEYDTLVIAVGSITSYFGHDDWREYAHGLKSIEDATAMRGRIFRAFEHAELEGAEHGAPWLTFVIVGGGPTGVELAGALSEIARKTLKDDFRSIRPEQAQLILMDMAPRILTTFSERISSHAEKALVKLGVRVRCGVRVNSIDEDGVKFQCADGSSAHIAARTVLWAGGVEVPPLAKELARAAQAPVDRKGRIEVLPDLSIPGHPEIFVTGDLAVVANPKGGTLPGVAQVALQEGRYAGKVIARRLAAKPAPGPFHYFDRGDMAVIGRNCAVANIRGFELWGWPAWVIWLTIHLMYLLQFQNRLIVMLRWAFQYLTFQRGARLITRSESPKQTPVV